MTCPRPFPLAAVLFVEKSGLSVKQRVFTIFNASSGCGDGDSPVFQDGSGPCAGKGSIYPPAGPLKVGADRGLCASFCISLTTRLVLLCPFMNV